MTSAQVYITDKNGGKHWNTICGAGYTAPEVRNMERHLALAAKHQAHYGFLDLATARIVVEGKEPIISEDDLLRELLA